MGAITSYTSGGGSFTSATPVISTNTITGRTLPDRFAETFNAKDFGAIGDGNSHPLSGVFATLLEAQSIYPKATALTNEIDWCAVQKALDTAGVKGGLVVIPAGRYRMSNELVIPEIANSDDGYTAVDITGHGMRNTVLQWDTDLGAGKLAIRPPDQVDSYMRSKISDITFYGPRDVDTLGIAPANMDGVGVGHRFVLDRVQIEWFRAGLNIIGDHSYFISCEITKNYYGAYWAADATNRGDHNFISCGINGNKFANLAVSNINTLDASVFTGCHLGFAPYGIYAETGTRTLAALSNTTFTDCSFEAIGNAIYAAQGTFTGYNGMTTTSFIQCSGTQSNDYKLSAVAFTAWINANVDRCRFEGGHGMFGQHQSTPTAIFGGKLTSSYMADFRDLTYLNSSVALCVDDCSGSTFKNGSVEGIISYVYDNAAVYGTVVGHWYESVGAMRSGSMVAGVVTHDAPSSHQFAMVARTGIVEVKKTTSAAINVNDIIQASTTYGSVETATASTRPIVGFAKFGAGSSDATIWMFVQITHRM